MNLESTIFDSFIRKLLNLKIQKSHFPFSAQLRSSSAKNLLVLTIPPATQAKLHCAAVIKCCETATETGIPQIQRAVRVSFDFDDKCRRHLFVKEKVNSSGHISELELEISNEKGLWPRQFTFFQFDIQRHVT